MSENSDVKATAKAEAKMLPVKILRGYWPHNPPKPKDGEEQRFKFLPGEVIELPAEEARRAVKLGIAERADSF